MKKGGPSRPGQDPTLETAVGVVACIILGIFLSTARTLDSGGALAMRAAAPARPPSGVTHKSPTPATLTESPAPPSPGASTSAAPPPTAQPHMKIPGAFQVEIPYATADASAYPEPVRKLVDASVQAALAGNTLMANNQPRAVSDAHAVLEGQKDSLKDLNFSNPAWRGIYKKEVALVSLLERCGAKIKEGADNDDEDVGEAMMKAGRAKLKPALQKLQKLILFIEKLRQKGETSKA